MLSKFFYKFGDITRKFNVPNSWSDVSFKTYYEFMKIVEDGAKPLDIYSLFTGMDKEYWEKDHDPKLFISLDGQLAFLSQLPVAEIPTHLERNEEYYKIPTDFGRLKLGKYRDIVEIVSSIKGDKQSDQLAIYAKMISVIACDNYDSEEDLEEIASDIWQMPCDQVLSLGGFFLKRNNRETLTKKPNGEYLQAGFDQISSDYGYFYSLYSLSKGDLTKYKEILNETVVNVYRTSQLQSRINESERIYSDLKSRKR